MIAEYQPSEFLSDITSNDNNNVPLSFRDSDICGEGASCRVYRMRLNGIRVAVKRLMPQHRDNPIFPASYRKEYQLGIQLRHPALPVYRALHEDKEEMYLVIDYIDGITLTQFLETEEGQHFFNEKKNVKSFLGQLLDVITYLHRNGIVHCDVKPSNVMLRNSDRGVMLIDLDKAYSPTFDRSFGATPGLPEPTSKEKIPTIHDDFISLAKLSEYIEERSAPSKHNRFKTFRAECRNPEATDASVGEALKRTPVSTLRIWPAIGIGGSAIAILCALFFLFDNSIGKRHPAPDLITGQSDTIEIVKTLTNSDLSENQGASKLPQANNPEDLTTNPTPLAAATAPPDTKTPANAASMKPQEAADFNFDKEMSDFVNSLKIMEKRLKSGNTTIDELYRMRTDIITLRTEKAKELYVKYQKCNPLVSESELINSFMKITNESKSDKYYQQLFLQIGDSIQKKMEFN
ncbi:MAG: protein kinase [Muribaculaceae bacterium]|nr:protein kinase [Muribaculaceae bacterium]